MQNAPETGPSGPAGAPVNPGMLPLMLAALAMLGPFSIDSYLPAFPAIQSSLQAAPLEVQQTLTAYMFSFAVMTLWHGALSDSFGRRRTILAALAVFAVATLGCAFAPSIQHLWLFRVLQGLSAGAGMVVGRAIIRDLYAGAPAERLLSMVMMIFSIAPAIAPVIGGWIVTLLGWRHIFLLLFCYSALLLWWCHRRLPETLPPEKRQSLRPHALLLRYRRIFRSAMFNLRAGAIAFNFAGLFLYVSAAPAFITRHLGLGVHQFGWQFIPAVAGIFLGSMAASRLAGALPVTRTVLLGFCILNTAALSNVAFHLLYPPALPWSVIPLFFYTFGMSLVLPGATMMVLDLFPAMRGTVASCQSFSMMMLGALVAGVLVPILDESALRLAGGQLGCGAIAASCWAASRLCSTHPGRGEERT